MHDIRTALGTSLIMLMFFYGVQLVLARPQSVPHALHVTFLDVGQGDAVLIESPSGTQVLIDGGKDAQVLHGLQEELGFFDTDLDMVVATHPDADHIGGLIDVLKKYEVETILLTENAADTPVYDAFMSAVESEEATVLYARKGQVYALGEGEAGTTTLTILFPTVDPTHLESNTASIIAQLRYGESEYLLMGDAPKAIEEYLVAEGGERLESDVLKVGHHGSRTSTAETFVAAVRPAHAVISAGKDNSYGHPHPEVTEVLDRYGVARKSTAEEGHIRSITDGYEVRFE